MSRSARFREKGGIKREIGNSASFSCTILKAKMSISVRKGRIPRFRTQKCPFPREKMQILRFIEQKRRIPRNSAKMWEFREKVETPRFFPRSRNRGNLRGLIIVIPRLILLINLKSEFKYLYPLWRYRRINLYLKWALPRRAAF